MTDIILVGPSSRHPGGLGVFTTGLARSLSELANLDFIQLTDIIPKAFYPLQGGDDIPGEQSDISNLRGKQLLFNPYKPTSWFLLLRFLKHSTASEAIILWWSAAASPFLLILALLIRLRSQRIALDIHEILDPSEGRRLILRVVGKVAFWMTSTQSDLIFHAEENIQAAKELVQGKQRRMTYIPHPLFTHYPKFSKAKARALLGIQTPFLLLTFGSLRTYKGITTALEAFELLPDRLKEKTTFAVVGARWGNESSPILERVRSSTAVDRIVLRTEYVSPPEVGMWFSAADIVLLPYNRSSQSGVVRIGMAHGLECICSFSSDTSRLSRIYSGIHVILDGGPVSWASRIREILEREPQTHQPPGELEWRNVTKTYIEFLQHGTVREDFT